mmetsp:Transcript_33157/g.41026  ORF Transcript_33157/g.41026 Transcript_33157/m.41026 type:complete len:83 (-) Transcript_33157:3185-3433(-)
MNRNRLSVIREDRADSVMTRSECSSGDDGEGIMIVEVESAHDSPKSGRNVAAGLILAQNLRHSSVDSAEESVEERLTESAIR